MKWTADSLNGDHEIEWTVTTDNAEDAERLRKFLMGDGIEVNIFFRTRGADAVKAKLEEMRELWEQISAMPITIEASAAKEGPHDTE